MRRTLLQRLAGTAAVWMAISSTTFAQAPNRDAEPAPAGNRQAPAQAGAAAALDPARLDWLLGKWEHQSSLLKTLDVAILRIDDAPAWGDREYYEGRALFKTPNRAFIDFNKIKVDEKKKPMKNAENKFISTPYERIVCTGNEVWQYRSDTQQIFVFPLQKDQQQKAIDEGPLPFLFNMKADEARQRYHLRLSGEDEKAFVVQIKPKLDVDKESFSVAVVNLDKKYLLPTRIVMLSPDAKSQKDFRLGPMYPNRQVNDKNFDARPLGPPWKVVRNPGADEAPREGVPGGARRPVGPAARRTAPVEGTKRR